MAKEYLKRPTSSHHQHIVRDGSVKLLDLCRELLQRVRILWYESAAGDKEKSVVSVTRKRYFLPSLHPRQRLKRPSKGPFIKDVRTGGSKNRPILRTNSLTEVRTRGRRSKNPKILRTYLMEAFDLGLYAIRGRPA